MTVAEALRHGARRLAGIEGGARDARVLLAFVMGVDTAALLRDQDAAADQAAFDAVLTRRAAREPVALIVGRQGFWTLDLEVSRVTLIPRPDSETLIEAAVAARPERGRVRRVLDLGTGTGCLLLAALAEFPEAWGLGVDAVPEAAALAARNARRNGLDGRAGFTVGCWANAVVGPFDLVLSNPPYIAGHEMAELMPDVRDHEPRLALDGGVDGLDAYRDLIAALPTLISQRGLAVFEVGIGQAKVVEELATQVGFRANTRLDLGGVARAVVFERAIAPTCNSAR